MQLVASWKRKPVKHGNMETGKLFVIVDFRNALNTVHRDVILEAVANHLP